MKRILIVLTLLCLVTISPIKAENLNKSKAIFNIGFLLSEIISYSYDLTYVKMCAAQIEIYKKLLSPGETENLKLMINKSSGSTELNDSMMKVSDNFYQSLNETSRFDYLYGSIVSNMGVDLISNKITYDNRLKLMHDYLHSQNHPTKSNMNNILENLKSKNVNKDAVKKEINEIVNYHVKDNSNSKVVNK